MGSTSDRIGSWSARAGRAGAAALDQARGWWRGLAARRLAERGPLPDRLEFRPESLTIGQPERAERFLEGSFAFDGVSAVAADGDPWRIAPPGEGWAEALHGFGWLTHFRAADGQLARETARRLARQWLDHCGGWDAVGWRPAIVGDRICAWIHSGALLTENAEMVYRSAFFRSLATQARYLRRSARDERDPRRRMRAGLGLIMAGLGLAGHGELYGEGLMLVEEALDEALLADGGPASRDPSDALAILERLTQLRADLTLARRETSPAIADAIQRIAPILRLYRQADGGLGLFNGAREDSDGRVDRALAGANVSTPAPPRAIESGFQRLSRGRVVALFDVGAPPTGWASENAHAGCLALEIGVGRRRMVVNCGSGAHLDAEWAIGCRGAAAHSTLSLDETSPVHFAPPDRKAPRRIIGGPSEVKNERRDEAEGSWALGAHDGYLAKHGYWHYRRLFMASDGADLRGEDTLLRPENARAPQRDVAPFVIRFHLHPEVEVAAARDEAGDYALLALPGGDVWVMRQRGGELGIDESVYLGRAGAPQPTKQIVIKGEARGPSAQVKWRFSRAAEAGAAPRDFTPVDMSWMRELGSEDAITLPRPPFRG